MKHAYFAFEDMQHDFCKFSPSFVVQNGTFEQAIERNSEKRV